jgi:multidrug efflux pump subunit AcrA (membrane-fusion protein)
MTSMQKTMIGLGATGLLFAAGVVAFVTFTAGGRMPGPSDPGDPVQDTPPPAENSIRVTALHPKKDPSFVMNVEEPAYVRAYYEANLKARAAGPVSFIQKDIGDTVRGPHDGKPGERLVTIDVPDLVEQVALKNQIVAERQRELQLSQANLKRSEAVVKMAQAAVNAALADESFRGKEFQRFSRLAREGGVTTDIVEERQQFYDTAKANVQKAEADVQKAQADVEYANADVGLKRTLIQVSEKDRDQAQALLDFATVSAPFDGVITRRFVDPGSFVQNATTSNTEPVLTVERTDIVTVFMKVPDDYAAYVTNDTEALIQMSGLPGVVLHGKVSRFSPSLQNPQNDRTMRVEVDLYNGSAQEYDAFLAREKKNDNADLKNGQLPWFPKVSAKVAGTHQALLPGMYGTMKLELRKFQNVYLLPSSAIVSHGGVPYIFVVKDGVAHQVPVEVQVDDGRMAKVSTIVHVGNERVKKPLMGDEIVVSSNQAELSDGQPVTATVTDW